MKPELQLHEARIDGSITQVEYSIVGDHCIANVTQHLKNSWLIPVADDLNEYGDRYIGEYFKDHLRKIVTVYLERMLS
jgi:hypothetical protein